jgi:hypothetical protein
VRGRRHISSALAGALAGRPEARLAAASAAFAEALGWPLSREVRLRAFTREGQLIAVAAGERWAEQVRAAAPTIAARMNGRLGAGSVRGLEVRVGPLER